MIQLGAVIVYVVLAKAANASAAAVIPGVPATIFDVILAWVLPNYSMTPEYRFLLLRGRFRKW